MQRILKVLIQFFNIEMRQILAYRWEFWSSFIGQTFIVVSINYFLWSAIFQARGVESLKGMSLTDFILYYLLVQLISKLQQGFSVGFLSRDIYYGTLNKFLLYPFSVILVKLASYSAHSFFYFLQLLILILLHKFTWGNSVTLVPLLQATLILFLGMVCYFMMAAIIELVAFWADNAWSLSILLKTFSHFFGGYFIPLSFYPENFRNLLDYTPFPYMMSEPINILMNLSSRNLSQTVLIILMWILGLSFIFRKVWEKGNKVYTGAGI